LAQKFLFPTMKNLFSNSKKNHSIFSILSKYSSKKSWNDTELDVESNKRIFLDELYRLIAHILNEQNPSASRCPCSTIFENGLRPQDPPL